MYHRITLFLFTFLLFAHAGLGEDANPKSVSDQEKSPAPEEPTKSSPLSGVFEAIQAFEIVADTEHTLSFEIKRLIDHGVLVQKGASIVQFKTKEIDKQIKDAEVDLQLSILSLKNEEFKHTQFLKTQALDRDSAQRKRRLAQQAYDNFTQVDRDRQVLTAAFNRKASQASLDNSLEELQQLEQMYKEDDLTEESEEIVLKRAKQAVDFARYRLEGMKIRSNRSVKQSIPNTLAQEEDSLARAEVTYQSAIGELALSRQRREIELRQKRDELKQQKQKLSERKEERKQVVLTSPFDGFVLHGKLNRGRLSDKASTLKVGSKVTSKQIVATVVNPRRLQIHVALEEKDLGVVTVGASCKVTAKAFPEFETTGTVKFVSPIAYAGVKHDCIITFRRTKNQPGILPTMTCDLEFPATDPEQKTKENSDSKEPAKRDGDVQGEDTKDNESDEKS